MRRLAILLLLIGGLLYADWVVEFFLPVALSPVTSFISELSALDEPYHAVFRTLDVAGGLIVMAGAVCAFAASPKSRALVAGWSALALFGLSNVLDAMTPLSCTITVREACTDQIPQDPWNWVGDPHVYASTGEEVFFAIAFVAIALAMRGSGASRFDRHFALGLGALTVLASALSGLLDVELTFLGHNDLLGLVQRAEVLLIACWIALVPGRLVMLAVPRPAGSLALSRGFRSTHQP
jgi:hypothetical protein